MIERTIARWHDHLRGKLPGGLDEILADDVVFYSPIVFSPQKGKEITKLYLNAAGNTLGGGEDGFAGVKPDAESGGGFRYTKEVLADPHAVLEFETTMDGLYVNGVDIITCNADAKITEFRVMIRPLQAIQAVHAQMARMLETMKSA